MSVLVVVAVIEEAQLPTFDVTELHYDPMDTLTGVRIESTVSSLFSSMVP